MSLFTPRAQLRNQLHRDWGNYATQAELPNALVPLSAPDFGLEAGDTAYVDGLGTFYCADPGTDGGADAIWTATAGPDHQTARYIVGNALNGDTEDDVDFLDPGDGTGLAAAVAASNADGGANEIYIRPGRYTLDEVAIAAIAPLPWNLGNGTVMRGAPHQAASPEQFNSGTIIETSSVERTLIEGIVGILGVYALQDLIIEVPPPATGGAATGAYLLLMSATRLTDVYIREIGDWTNLGSFETITNYLNGANAAAGTHIDRLIIDGGNAPANGGGAQTAIRTHATAFSDLDAVFDSILIRGPFTRGLEIYEGAEVIINDLRLEGLGAEGLYIDQGIGVDLTINGFVARGCTGRVIFCTQGNSVAVSGVSIECNVPAPVAPLVEFDDCDNVVVTSVVLGGTYAGVAMRVSGSTNDRLSVEGFVSDLTGPPGAALDLAGLRYVALSGVSCPAPGAVVDNCANVVVSSTLINGIGAPFALTNNSNLLAAACFFDPAAVTTDGTSTADLSHCKATT